MSELSFTLKDPDIKKLLELSSLLFDISGATELLHWDQETYMPHRGILHRSRQLATLSDLYHEKLSAKTSGNLITNAAHVVGANPDKYTLADKALVREMRREHDKAVKIPSRLVRALAEAASVGLESWKAARKEKSFRKFQPALARILELKFKEAECLGYKDSPYDAMLDDYEPGLTTKQVSRIFEPLRIELTGLLGKILQSSRPQPEYFLKNQHFDTGKAKKATEKMLAKIGYDFSAGRQDISAHPFTINFGHADVRVTNRFDPHDLGSSIFSAIHEGGHGLYELGISEAIGNTLLASGTSLGIHESQSRLWENLIGRSKEFWTYWLPYLQGEFSGQLKKATVSDIYREVNRVENSLIRVEADEVTYNLHIILRFEIERDLFDKKIRVADLPEVWNSKMKEFLGIVPPNDGQGVLQDIHWSQGSVGYFPTYTLGNLYSAQLYQVMVKDIGEVGKHIESGNFEPVLRWLRKNIHHYGSVFQAEELIKRVTGEGLNPKYFADYLNRKYGDLYGF